MKNETPRQAVPAHGTLDRIDLDAYRWQQRLVLVFTASPDDPGLEQQRSRLESEQHGCAERDIVIGYLPTTGAGSLDGQAVSADAIGQIRTRLDVGVDRFQVLLIGKDGGVKHRADAPIAPQELFDMIDAMPMRQQEMRPDSDR